MKYFYTLLLAFSFSFNTHAQCDPNVQWVDFGPEYPSNVLVGIFTDVYNDELYVLARVTPASPGWNYEILKLDTISNTWDSITSFTETCYLYSFKVFGNDIFVGGAICNFNGSNNYSMMARYDGTQWNPVPEFVGLINDGIVHDFEIYNGELYASGSFDDSLSNLNGIAKYDGASWIPLGLGLETNIMGVSGNSLEVHNGLLYVSGRFTQSSPLNNVNFAAYDGNNWLSVPPLSGVAGVFPYTLVNLDTCLIVTGQNILGPNTSCAKLQNGAWQAMSPLNYASHTRDFTRLNGELYTSAFGTDAKIEIHRYNNGNWDVMPGAKTLYQYGGILNYKNRLLLPSSYYSCGSSLNKIAVLCDTTECGVIEGRVFVDTNLNCVDDVEPVIPVPVIQISPLNQSVVIDSLGDYRRLIPAGNYDVSVQSPQWYSPYCPSAAQNVTVVSGNNPVVADFSLEATLNIQDVEITATALVARVGQPTAIYLTVRNIGTTPLDATVDISNNGLINYDSSDVVITSTGVNQLEWNVGNLDVYETKNAVLYFTVPPNINLLGQNFLSSFNGSVTNGIDPDLTNNVANTDQNIIAAYDPNKKTVSPVGETINGITGLIPASTPEFEYTIYFQNTGIDTAFNIVILDTIQSILDISTFTLLSSSHSVQTSIIGNNMLQFSFDNILLPDSSTNLIGSQGFVKFRIRPASPLLVGDVIKNQAEIYFDINPPIYTNFTSNTVSEIALVEEETSLSGTSINVFPNPFSSCITVEVDGIDLFKNTQLRLYNLSGQILETVNFEGSSNVVLERKSLNSGVYLISVFSDDALIGTKKVIIE